MPLTWTLFGNLTNPGLGELDNNFTQLAAMASVPCTFSGTNAITMTPLVSAIPIGTYFNYMVFMGIAVATNTGSTTASYGSLTSLNVYKDSSSGPVALSGGEIVSGNAVFLTYDGALNGGSGGFHLATGPAVIASGLAGSSLRVPSSAPSSITSILSASASITFTSLAPGGNSDQTITISGVSVGDVVALAYPATIQVGIGYYGFVSAASIVTVRAFNYTPASTLTPTGGTYRATAFRSSP